MSWQDDEPPPYQDGDNTRRARVARILGASLPLFRAGGIRFRLHWSFPLVAFVFAGWTASESGGAPFGVLFVWGLAQAGILYSLVLLHELGHAVAGSVKGRPASEIVLTPLGGQAVIDRAMATPGMEAEVAFAGPAVNLVLLALSMAAVALAGWGWLASWGAPFTLHAVLGFAFWANVMLAVFNLVPAYPMDGGRLLRALLAWRRGAGPGTVLAARAGQVLGVAFVGIAFWKGGTPGWVLGCIGVFNFIHCHVTLKAVAEGYEPYEEYVGAPRADTEPRETKAEREMRERADVEQRVDELLDKVSREGMASLTFGEKRFLKKASRRYRDVQR